MIEKISSFVKKHAYETVLALFILIFGGSIAWAWQLTVDAVVEYPIPFFLICAISFVAGLVVSAVRDRRSAMLEEIKEETKREIDRRNREDESRREKEERARREEKRMRTVQDEFMKRVMEMEYGPKVALATLFELEEITLEWEDPYSELGFISGTEDFSCDPNYSLSELNSMKFATYENIDWDRRRWTLRENVVALLRDNKHLIECVSRDDQREMFGIK